MGTCLTTAEITAFLTGTLPGSERAGAEAHLAECTTCQQLVQQQQTTRGLSSVGIPAAPVNDPATNALTPDQLPAPAPGVVHVIPGYELSGEIHRGGQGIVYRAVQKATKRTVAVKVLLLGAFASPTQQRRFEREIDLAASLRHPNIVTVYDSGVTAEGLHYFAMEYVDGATLTHYLRTSGTKSLPDVLRLFVKICQAVNYAQQRGVIHRDLKPGNILIDREGEPHILDFGLARPANLDTGSAEEQRFTEVGEFLGTLAYASPEQVAGDPRRIDIRTDVYSLGVILYEMVTGRYPYPVFGPITDVLKAIAETEPEALSVLRRREKVLPVQQRSLSSKIDEHVEAIILKTLRKPPDERYQSAGALAEDIQHYLAGEPIQARPPSLTFLLRSWLRHNLSTAVWVVLVGLVCGGLNSLGMLLLYLPHRMRYCAAAYELFPDLDPPWLARDWSLPAWLIVCSGLVGLVAMSGIGLAAAGLVQSRNWRDDLGVGGLAGFIAGALGFAICFGTIGVMQVALVPSFEDLALVSETHRSELPVDRPKLALGKVGIESEVDQSPVDDPLLYRYPELKQVEEKNRALLAAKIMADIAVGIPIGIWLSLSLSLVIGTSLAAVEAVLAGHLLRRPESGWRRMLCYFLVVLPCLFSAFRLLLLFFPYHVFSVMTPYLTILMVLVGSLTALLGITHRWNWPVWETVGVVFAFLMLQLTFSFSALDAVVVGCLLFAWGRYFVRRRQRLQAAPASS